MTAIEDLQEEAARRREKHIQICIADIKKCIVNALVHDTSTWFTAPLVLSDEIRKHLHEQGFETEILKGRWWALTYQFDRLVVRWSRNNTGAGEDHSK